MKTFHLQIVTPHGELFDGQPACQPVGNGKDGRFSHAVGKQVGLRIQQNGALKPVRPVVIVG